jgi:hypothetical protein
LGQGAFSTLHAPPWLAIGGKREGGLICQGDFIRKIAFENSFGFQTQIDALRLKVAFSGVTPKTRVQEEVIKKTPPLFQEMGFQILLTIPSLRARVLESVFLWG